MPVGDGSLDFEHDKILQRIKREKRDAFIFVKFKSEGFTKCKAFVY